LPSPPGAGKQRLSIHDAFFQKWGMYHIMQQSKDVIR
jgi:hypothetical protein